MGFINISGKNIYIENQGRENKKVLLYLHGGPGASCLDFQNQCYKIGKYHNVIAIDQYGVLRSDAIPDYEDYGMVKQIEMLEQMRVQLNIEKWSLLGHSYGGMLACLYTNLYPASISSVIYECPSFNFTLSTKSVAKYLLGYFNNIQNTEGASLCYEIINKAYLENDNMAIDDMSKILNLSSDNPKIRNYLHNISYEEYIASYSTEEITSDMWAKGNIHYVKLVKDGKMFMNFLPLLSENHQPSLLITGKYDSVCSNEQIDYYMKHAPHAHIKEFENSGHFPRIEEANEYTKCVCEFISAYAK